MAYEPEVIHVRIPVRIEGDCLVDADGKVVMQRDPITGNFNGAGKTYHFHPGDLPSDAAANGLVVEVVHHPV